MSSPGRLVANTHDPIRTALVIDYLLAFVDGKAANTPEEEALRERLREINADGAIDRMAAVFRSRERQMVRQQTFGELPDDHLRSLAPDMLSRLTASAAVSLYRDDVNIDPPPNYPSDTRFTVYYEGFYCYERTGDRWIFGASDEPYVITTSIHLGDNGNNVVPDGQVHPLGATNKWYHDIDTREWEVGPRAAVWSNTLREVVLVTTVMEKDNGDPDHVKKIIEDAVKAVAAVVEWIFGVDVPGWAERLLAEVTNWLIDPEDDQIGMTSFRLTEPSLRYGAHNSANNHNSQYTVRREILVPTAPFEFEERTEYDKTGIRYYFLTRHNEDGDYRVLYTVEADKAPLDDLSDRLVEFPTRIDIGTKGRVWADI